MGQCIYLTDLDDTLFRSSHKHPQGEAFTRVTTATNGHHGHMNPAQQGLLSALRATGAVIPVTARSTDAFSRVHLDFGTRRAILANGAVILNAEGVADPAWLAHTAHIGRSAETLLLDMSALIGAELGSAARSWIVEEYGAPVYFCVKMNATGVAEVRSGITAAAERLASRFDLSGLQQHANGNNLSFTPIGISKREACRHLIDSIRDGGGAPLIGIGDSLTDLPFMGLCDFIMTPSGSQIADLMARMTDGDLTP
ncbi:hydroxymethylpyrimidine pyrophosphatase-like HAD family hydrolase [Marinobacter sp. LV10MA510-1]|nr:hydroxymethylpyrimidine pyrophosphatase-like HAD family hydrolase [Marinobacter sp. LV10MA510-1]